MGHKQNFKHDTKLPFLVLVVNWAEEIQKVSGYGKWTSIFPSGHAVTFMGSTGRPTLHGSGPSTHKNA